MIDKPFWGLFENPSSTHARPPPHISPSQAQHGQRTFCCKPWVPHFSSCSCRLLSFCPYWCWRGYSRVHQRGQGDQIQSADISPVSLPLCLLFAATAWPRRIDWQKQLLQKQRKKDAPCCDFCRPVSFISPFLLPLTSSVVFLPSSLKLSLSIPAMLQKALCITK